MRERKRRYLKSYGSFFVPAVGVRIGRDRRGGMWRKRGTYVVEGPLDLVGEHAVHVGHDLDGHVDEPLGEDEADVGLGVGPEEGLEF